MSSYAFGKAPYDVDAEIAHMRQYLQPSSPEPSYQDRDAWRERYEGGQGTQGSGVGNILSFPIRAVRGVLNTVNGAVDGLLGGVEGAIRSPFGNRDGQAYGRQPFDSPSSEFPGGRAPFFSERPDFGPETMPSVPGGRQRGRGGHGTHGRSGGRSVAHAAPKNYDAVKKGEVPAFRLKDTGEGVKELQKKIDALLQKIKTTTGEHPALEPFKKKDGSFGLDVDGVIGPKTQKGIEFVQKLMDPKATPDLKAGKITIKGLEEMLAGKTPTIPAAAPTTTPPADGKTVPGDGSKIAPPVDATKVVRADEPRTGGTEITVVPGGAKVFFPAKSGDGSAGEVKEIDASAGPAPEVRITTGEEGLPAGGTLVSPVPGGASVFFPPKPSEAGEPTSDEVAVEPGADETVEEGEVVEEVEEAP